MAVTQKKVVSGAIWTVGAYGASTLLRFGSNVVLSRLVAPEIFGTMLIISTLRTGMELVSDVGFAQNIVQNKDGDKPRFYHTAWTMQFVRGLILFGLLALAAAPLGRLYALPTEAIQLGALTLAILGGASASIYLLHRRMQLIRLNLFDLTIDFIGAIVTIALALYSPTIWALVIANVVVAAIRATLSYALPESRMRFAWDPAYAAQIFHFGKWIFVSSLVAFLCANLDRLYLGQAVPLAILGIYGIARNIADIPNALIGRLSYSVLFPAISAEQNHGRESLRGRLAPLRFKLLALCALAIAFGATVSDWAVEVIYDDRYHQAGWMLAMLLIGVWGAIVCTISDYALLGVGKPLYGASGNFVKLALLGVFMPLALSHYGLAGAIVAIMLAEIGRYAPIVLGQRREQLSFLRQDVVATALMLALVVAFSFLRWELGYGTAFDGVFLDGHL